MCCDCWLHAETHREANSHLNAVSSFEVFFAEKLSFACMSKMKRSFVKLERIK